MNEPIWTPPSGPVVPNAWQLLYPKLPPGVRPQETFDALQSIYEGHPAPRYPHDGQPSASRAVGDALHRFTKTRIGQFVKRATPNASAAAQVGMELLYWLTQGEDDQSLESSVKAAEGDSDGNLDTALGAGTDDKGLEYLKKLLRLRPMINGLRFFYSRAAVIHHGRSESLFPAYDVDVRTIRTFREKPLILDAMRAAASPVRGALDYALKRTRTLQHYAATADPREGKERTYAVAIDVSGSMEAQLTSNVQRHEYAIASAIALLEQALKGANSVAVYFFDGAPKPPVRGTPQEIIKALLDFPFSGGGTNIEAALDAIEAEGAVEMIMISDGDAGVRTKRPAPPCPLTTIIINESAPRGSYTSGAMAWLRQNSRQFLHVTGDTLGVM